MRTSFLKSSLRWAIGIAILYFLFLTMDIPACQAAIRESLGHWKWWSAGIALTFLALYAGVFRWQQLLKVQGFNLSHLETFRIFFIGQFFNAFLLGACGGDVARAFYVAKDRRGQRAEAASTVLVDRVIGLFVVVAFCCGMILYRSPFFLASRRRETVGLVMLGFLLISILGFVVFFRKNAFEHWPLFRKIEDKSRMGTLFKRTYAALYLYRNRPGTLFHATFFSLLNISFQTLACYSFGRSLNIPNPVVDYFTLFPIITVLAAIPITPGALGIREGLFSEMFKGVGVISAKSVPLSLMVYLGGAFWSLLGWIFFMYTSAGAGHSLREELKEIEGVVKNTEQ